MTYEVLDIHNHYDAVLNADAKQANESDTCRDGEFHGTGDLIEDPLPPSGYGKDKEQDT